MKHEMKKKEKEKEKEQVNGELHSSISSRPDPDPCIPRRITTALADLEYHPRVYECWRG
jgi:hypothetical protein